MSEIPNYEPIDNSSDVLEGEEGQAARNTAARAENKPIISEMLNLLKKGGDINEEQLLKLEGMLNPGKVVSSEYSINSLDATEQEVLEFEKQAEIQISNISETINNIGGDELLDIAMNLLKKWGQEASKQLDDILKIEKIAPGFIKDVQSIENDLSLALDFDEELPDLIPLKIHFDSVNFPVNNLLEKIKNGTGEAEVEVRNAVKSYLTSINTVLDIYDIAKLQVKVLD